MIKYIICQKKITMHITENPSGRLIVDKKWAIYSTRRYEHD